MVGGDSKIISFQTFRKYCNTDPTNRDIIYEHCDGFLDNKKCTLKNCPTWKRLKEVKDE